MLMKFAIAVSKQLSSRLCWAYQRFIYGWNPSNENTFFMAAKTHDTHMILLIKVSLTAEVIFFLTRKTT